MRNECSWCIFAANVHLSAKKTIALLTGAPPQSMGYTSGWTDADHNVSRNTLNRRNKQIPAPKSDIKQPSAMAYTDQLYSVFHDVTSPSRRLNLMAVKLQTIQLLSLSIVMKRTVSPISI